jgi:hypothetical protein
MSTLRHTALALAFLGSGALFSAPCLAVEPDVDSTAGPQLPAPRHEPGFQVDDQAGQSKLVPELEVGEGPAIIVPDADPAAPVLPPPPEPAPAP